MLINKKDPNLFYIGSSNNLAIRMEGKIKLTKGLRKPHSSYELEISNTSALIQKLEFIFITTPQPSLVYEQYTILKLKPTINKNLNVIRPPAKQGNG